MLGSPFVSTAVGGARPYDSPGLGLSCIGEVQRGVLRGSAVAGFLLSQSFPLDDSGMTVHVAVSQNTGPQYTNPKIL